jgi:3-methyladenine DNA glycosylase AlkD
VPAAEDILDRVVPALAARRDPQRARAMAAYMRGLFPFLGIPTPQRRALAREVLAGLPRPVEADLLEVARRLWEMPEREYQYVGCDLLARGAGRLSPAALPEIERLITTQSWWDTVDALATRVVGRLVLAHPGLRPDMDRWLDSESLWLVRSAILHQERWRERTDPDWLFAACARHAEARDVFVRKAIGWALRSYARIDPVAVRDFVEKQSERLSGLSRREALRGVARAGG